MILQVLIGVLSGLIVGHLRESQHLNSKIEFSPRRISSSNPLSLTISPQIWVPEQTADLTVTTGNFDAFEDTDKVNLVIDLFYNEVQPSSSASGVKYYHQGKIKNFRKLEISPNSDYSIKFEPPAILKDGAHTVVVSISETSDEDGNEQILMHAVTPVEVRNGRKTDDISVHDDSPSPNQPNNKAISASFNEIPLEHVISRIDSLSDLCRLCRSSLSVQKKCDDIFQHSFPKLYQLPLNRQEFGGLKDQRPLTTFDICRFDLMEQHLDRLEFKYIYYSSDLDFQKIKQPIELIKWHVFKKQWRFGKPTNNNMRPRVGTDKVDQSTPPLIIWSHPNILALFKVYYAARFAVLDVFFTHVFRNFERSEVTQIFKDEGKDVDLEIVMEGLEAMRKIPRSEEFKLELAKTLTFDEVDGSIVMKSADSLGSLAILLDKELLVKKPDYLKQWKGMEAKNRLHIFNQIIEW